MKSIYQILNQNNIIKQDVTKDNCRNIIKKYLVKQIINKVTNNQTTMKLMWQMFYYDVLGDAKGQYQIKITYQQFKKVIDSMLIDFLKRGK